MNDRPKDPRYIVHFTGRGYTASDEHNPNGVRVTGKGFVVVDGVRPSRTFDIPWVVIEGCKKVFMKQCHCVRYDGDTPGCERFPTVKLGKAL